MPTRLKLDMTWTWGESEITTATMGWIDAFLSTLADAGRNAITA
jgi:hypothetical protein